MEALHTRIATIVGTLAGRDPASIGPGNTLGEISKPNQYDLNGESEPLGLDSMDRILLVQMVEDEFRVQITDDEVDAMEDNMGALVALVADKLSETPLQLREEDKLTCPTCGKPV